MLKITLPNGVVIEGDANDLGLVIQNIIATPKEEAKTVAVETVPEKTVPEETVTEETVTKEKAPVNKSTTFPHCYSNNRNYRTVIIGERQDQAMQAGKLIAEQAGNRSQEFTTREILEVINDPKCSIWIVGSALQGLARKGLVRHGRHSRCWYVTEAGWVARYRVVMPVRGVGPTT